MKKERDLIEKIYNALYERVDEKYYGLIIFAQEKAKEKRIRFQKNYYERTKNKRNRSEVLFYFLRNNKAIKFTLFDYFLSNVDFSNKFIY